MKWSNDHELFSIMKRNLFSAVIGDIMDKMGYLNQFLPPAIKPLRKDMLVAGRAMTVLEADVHNEFSGSGNNPLLDKPFGLMLEALDDLKQDEIYICTGSSPTYALWGELMSTPGNEIGIQRSCSQWIFQGYKRDFKIELPDIFVWQLCTGSGASWQSDRFQTGNRNEWS